ncbi:MAG: YlbF family regulator [Chrysiogenales bacterium]|nr:MAG: YlbF family regulator [Chrysiogenales bacterium]
MKDILAVAEKLGKMIKETETGRRFIRASELLNSDPDARRSVDEFASLSEHLKLRRDMGDIIE